jgi:hypothetical protein
LLAFLQNHWGTLLILLQFCGSRLDNHIDCKKSEILFPLKKTGLLNCMINIQYIPLYKLRKSASLSRSNLLAAGGFKQGSVQKVWLLLAPIY